MPELPELRLAAQFITRVCRTAVFAAPIVKSAVSTRNPDVALPEAYRRFRVSSESRGKELLLILRRADEPAPSSLVSKTAAASASAAAGKRGTKSGKSAAASAAAPTGTHAPIENNNALLEANDSVLKIIFRFGMSGHFFFGEPSQLPAHAHLMLRTEDGQRVLAFVDPRRWGHWALATDFDRRTRGPDATTEFAAFREHVRASLVASSGGGRSAAAFDVPICEMLLDQRYFNGIGNYLRAEILHRAGVRPFERARDALTRCFAAHELSTAAAAVQDESATASASSQKLKRGQVKAVASAASTASSETLSPLLSLCHSLPLEVVDLNLNYFAPDLSGDFNQFEQWLQVYQKGENMVDSNDRTIWYFGEPGPLVPKIKKQRRAVMNIAPEAVASKAAAAAAAAAEATAPVKAVKKPKANKTTKVSPMQKAAIAKAKASAEAEAANPTNAISAVSYVLMSAKRGKSSSKTTKVSAVAAIAPSASLAEVLTVDTAPSAKPSRKRKPLAHQGVIASSSATEALSPSTLAVRATRTNPSAALPLLKSPPLPAAAPSSVADEPRPAKRARVRASSRAL